MSLFSDVISSQPETTQGSPALILVALVIARIALGAFADRVGQEVRLDPAFATSPVAWDDRTGNPVVVAVSDSLQREAHQQVGRSIGANRPGIPAW